MSPAPHTQGKTLNRNAIRLAAATATAATALTAFGLSDNAAQAAGTTASTNAAAPAYGTTAVIHHPRGANDNAGTLRMVSPSGQYRTIGQVSDDARVADVSDTADRVITRRYDGEHTRFAIWNTRTKAMNYLKLPGDWGAGFTPDGILTWSNRTTPYGDLIYKRDFSGVAKARFTHGGYGAAVSVVGDGSRFIDNRLAYLQVRSTATGKVLATLGVPGNGSCGPATGLSATHFTLSCDTADMLGSRRGFALPYDGRTAATPVTPVGVDEVFSTTPVTAYLNGGQMHGPIQKATANAMTPLPANPSGDVTGARGTTIHMLVPGANVADKPQLLVRYDLRTGASTTLAGGAKGGMITSAQTVDGIR